MKKDEKSLEEIVEEMADEFGGYWDGEHPDYPFDDWLCEVENEYTRAGYWEWVVTNYFDDLDSDIEEDDE